MQSKIYKSNKYEILNTKNLLSSTKINYRLAGELLHHLVENAEDDITIEATALLGESVSFYEAIDVEYKNLFDESDEDYEYAIKLDAAISHYWEKRDFALFYCVNFLNIPMDDLYVSDSEILTESEILD